MTWVATTSDRGFTGFMLQCDTCGFIRPSNYKFDKKSPGLEYTWEGQQRSKNPDHLFLNQKLPKSWLNLRDQDDRIDAPDNHQCPWCQARERGQNPEEHFNAHEDQLRWLAEHRAAREAKRAAKEAARDET
jgi:hypothetical protein